MSLMGMSESMLSVTGFDSVMILFQVTKPEDVPDLAGYIAQLNFVAVVYLLLLAASIATIVMTLKKLGDYNKQRASMTLGFNLISAALSLVLLISYMVASADITEDGMGEMTKVTSFTVVIFIINIVAVAINLAMIFLYRDDQQLSENVRVSAFMAKYQEFIINGVFILLYLLFSVYIMAVIITVLNALVDENVRTISFIGLVAAFLLLSWRMVTMANHKKTNKQLKRGSNWMCLVVVAYFAICMYIVISSNEALLALDKAALLLDEPEPGYISLLVFVIGLASGLAFLCAAEQIVRSRCKYEKVLPEETRKRVYKRMKIGVYAMAGMFLLLMTLMFFSQGNVIYFPIE